jgi:hypothetical protein
MTKNQTRFQMDELRKVVKGDQAMEGTATTQDLNWSIGFFPESITVVSSPEIELLFERKELKKTKAVYESKGGTTLIVEDVTVKPACKLTGMDGNIFGVIARVSKTLERAGQRDRAKDFTDKVKQCKSYDEALALTFDYVDVE